MVAFEVVHHGEFVENSEEKKDVKTEVKFKPVNNELSEECTKIKPKVYFSVLTFLQNCFSRRDENKDQKKQLSLTSDYYRVSIFWLL